MKEITPRFVYETEIASMRESIEKLESVLEDTATAIAANQILLDGLIKNLEDIPEQSEFEIVE